MSVINLDSNTPRIKPAMKSAWHPGKDGKGQWRLAVDPNDLSEDPEVFPVPRIIRYPDTSVGGMAQFRANDSAGRLIYDTKGYLSVEAARTAKCPPERYVELMRAHNAERRRSKKPPVKIDPENIPGPHGTGSKRASDDGENGGRRGRA